MSTFISVGNSEYRFDRLIMSLKDILNTLPRPIIYQYGYSKKMDYFDKYFLQHKFVSLEEYYNILKNTKLFVSHLGAGSLLNSKKYQLNSVFLARRKKFKEHIDDHQYDLFTYLKEYKNKNNIFANATDLSNFLKNNSNFKNKTDNTKKSDIEKIINKIMF